MANQRKRGHYGCHLVMLGSRRRGASRGGDEDDESEDEAYVLDFVRPYELAIAALPDQDTDADADTDAADVDRDTDDRAGVGLKRNRDGEDSSNGDDQPPRTTAAGTLRSFSKRHRMGTASTKDAAAEALIAAGVPKFVQSAQIR